MPNSLMQNWEIAKNLWNTFGNNPDNQRTVEAMKGMTGLLPLGAGDAAAGLLAADDVRRGDYTSAALNGVGILPYVPALAGMTKGKADDIARAIKPTKYEQAHEVARKNAVKMLGLPENNTAMDRARALGYTTDGYHGSNYDIKAFDPDKSAQGGITWIAENPEMASQYARSGEAGGNVMPLLAKLENPVDWKGYDNLGLYEYKSRGHDGAWLPSSGGETSGFVMNPNQLRSRFAAFDPARINEPDLLGRVNPELLPWLTGAGLLGAGGMYYSE